MGGLQQALNVIIFLVYATMEIDKALQAISDVYKLFHNGPYITSGRIHLQYSIMNMKS